MHEGLNPLALSPAPSEQVILGNEYLVASSYDADAPTRPDLYDITDASQRMRGEVDNEAYFGRPVNYGDVVLTPNPAGEEQNQSPNVVGRSRVQITGAELLSILEAGLFGTRNGEPIELPEVEPIPTLEIEPLEDYEELFALGILALFGSGQRALESFQREDDRPLVDAA